MTTRARLDALEQACVALRSDLATQTVVLRQCEKRLAAAEERLKVRKPSLAKPGSKAKMSPEARLAQQQAVAANMRKSRWKKTGKKKARKA